VACVDQIDAVVGDKRQAVYLAYVIDMRIIHRVYMGKSLYVSLAAP
jgi:hypothetical protein